MIRRDRDRVIVLKGPEDIDTGRRLLAGLCFAHAAILFLKLVDQALVLSIEWHRRGFNPLHRLAVTLGGIVPMILLLAIAGWLILQPQARLRALLLTMAGAILAWYCLAVCGSMVMQHPNRFLLFGFVSYSQHPWLWRLSFFNQMWPLMGLLLAVLLAQRSANKLRFPWVRVAACWCAGEAFHWFGTIPLSAWVPRQLNWMALIVSANIWAVVACTLILAFAPRRALTALLVVLACRIGLPWTALHQWWSEVIVARTAHPLKDLRDTQWTFSLLCMQQFFQFAPLALVLASLLRHGRRLMLSDDGSPWPRRYCAKCFYNLHGVEADRCPECGAVINVSEPASIDAGGVRTG